MEFAVLKLDNKTFDVFEGKQFHNDSWTRLKAGSKGVYILKHGGKEKLSYAAVKALASAIDPKQAKQLVEI